VPRNVQGRVCREQDEVDHPTNSTLTHVALGSFMHGHGLRRAASLSIGVVAGAQLGALLSKRVPGHRIRQLLALGLIALAVRLGLSVI
jgi:uncharacterized membrane protein YfcA